MKGAAYGPLCWSATHTFPAFAVLVEGLAPMANWRPGEDRAASHWPPVTSPDGEPSTLVTDSDTGRGPTFKIEARSIA